MKAIILAGGRGSRLGKLTDSLPKVLMEMDGTTIIERQIKILNKIGIADITLVTGYGADLIKKKLSAYNVNLIQNEKYSTTDTLYAFWLAKHCMDDEFLHVVKINIKDTIKLIQSEQIVDSISVCAILYYIFKKRLQI